MRISIGIGSHSARDITGAVAFVQAADRLGVDCVWSAEAWAHDACTSLAYMAALTKRIHIGTAIMQISARTPSMTAMTALSLNDLSGGRFRLGLGVSGPQVVEGLQGVSFAKPLTRLRETVDICRMAFRGEKIQYQGQVHVLPRPGGEGKAIRLEHRPAPIPIYLATLGPKALEYTGEAADGWLGTSFSPDHPDAHLAYIRKGAEKAGRSLADIDICATAAVAIGENVEEMIDARRMGVAFQMGAMGSARTNFYNEAFQRAGYQDDALAIQALWKQGRRDEAAQRVPDAMVTQFQAVGTADMVRERLRKYRDVGVNMLSLRGDDTLPSHERIALLEQIMDLANGLDAAA
ncbi:MAG: LLM class flavin-dependent oxidoreductase [Alphaproteobacteria bacterium]|nr:LLM class flavin-dependent oxidoreductase [Alphaproteobacteria bacterium]